MNSTIDRSPSSEVPPEMVDRGRIALQQVATEL